MTHPTLHSRIYRYKLLAVAVILLAVGLLAKIFVDRLAEAGMDHLVVALLQNLCDAMIVLGAFGIGVDYFTGKEKEAADTERTRRVVKELVPDITDAVLHGLSASPDALERVATPELLDNVASNAMALRLGDEQFAHEIYRDIRDQAIRAAERWHDVQVRIRLSGIPERSTNGAPLFDVTVEWEYTTIPSHPIRKFACVSDRDEFNELTSEIPSTLTWFMRRRPGMDASKRECYELLSFTVDGHARPVRRAGRKTGQTYSVNIGEDVVAAGKAVRVRHIYRTVVSGAGHRLFVSLPQPAKDLAVHFDYSDTNIARLSVTDLFPSARPVQIDYLPEELPGKMVMATIPGWSLPRTGLVYVWTLSSEELSAGETTASRVA